MATTAFQVLLEIARLVGPVTEATATGGSTTTVVYSGMGGSDDEWNGGSAFLITDAGGAGAAPQAELASISDYVSASGTFTTTAFTAAVASGDTFGVVKVARATLYQSLNAALRDAGNLPSEDDTSLDTAANTLEYTIPAAAKGDLRQVWIATDTDAPYGYEECFFWRQIANKSSNDLIFDGQPRSGRDIRLVYCAPHAQITAASTSINEAIPIDYLVWRGAFHVYRQRLHQEGRKDDKWLAMMNEAAQYAQQALDRHPIRLPASSSHLFYAPDEPLEHGITTAEIPTA